MPRENQAELFIRVLAEEFVAYRTDRKFGFSRQAKVQAKRFRQFCKTDRKASVESREPLDCLQLMSPELQWRIGQ